MSEQLPLPADIVPPRLVIQAMRDNGYKNTAYALAELMDNSIQAGATQVELLCVEEQIILPERKRMRINQLAVLDNGVGMDETVLQVALQFGNGTHLKDRSGMGRFGMGLPSASISQCRRVEVWTWQAGVESARYSYLDLDEIENGTMRLVPDPIASEIPDLWREAGSTWGTSGTLVVWSQLDRLMWRSARAIMENSEFLIGRIYRRFIDGDRVKIRLAAFDLKKPGTPTIDELAQVNDPLYLVAPSSTDGPYDKTPMFAPWGETGEHLMKINYNDEIHEIKIRYSYAKEEARRTGPTGQQAGSMPHGKHAANNVGVSLIRADRELDLVTTGFVTGYDPLDRWWGAEVEFPPELDELFGVTNNKQTARNFNDVAGMDPNTLAEDGETEHAKQERLDEEADPRETLMRVTDEIKKNVGLMRRIIGDQQRSSRSKQRRYDADSPEVKGTAKTEERKQEGHVGASDAEEGLPNKEKAKLLEQLFVERGMDAKAAHEQAATVVNRGLKYVFQAADLKNPAFFSVESKAGVLTITLNTTHPAYVSLLEVMEAEPDEFASDNVDQLRGRLVGAASGLKLLLEAWARYEDELKGSTRDRASDARHDWGRVARQFFAEEE
jgi:hypothetical protein